MTTKRFKSTMRRGVVIAQTLRSPTTLLANPRNYEEVVVGKIIDKRLNRAKVSAL